jgi:hypothetical protein
MELRRRTGIRPGGVGSSSSGSATRWTPPPTGSSAERLDEAVASLEADPARKIAGEEAFRDWMQQLADRTVAELAGVHLNIP